MVRHLAVNQARRKSQVGSIPTLSAKLGSRLIGRISDFESEDVGSNPTSPAILFPVRLMVGRGALNSKIEVRFLAWEPTFKGEFMKMYTQCLLESKKYPNKSQTAFVEKIFAQENLLVTLENEGEEIWKIKKVYENSTLSLESLDQNRKARLSFKEKLK